MKTDWKYTYDEYSASTGNFVREVAWGMNLKEVRQGLREHYTRQCERYGDGDPSRISITAIEYCDGHKYRLNKHR